MGLGAWWEAEEQNLAKVSKFQNRHKSLHEICDRLPMVAPSPARLVLVRDPLDVLRLSHRARRHARGSVFVVGIPGGSICIRSLLGARIPS